MKQSIRGNKLTNGVRCALRLPSGNWPRSVPAAGPWRQRSPQQLGCASRAAIPQRHGPESWPDSIAFLYLLNASKC
jgi:hypothetical protein